MVNWPMWLNCTHSYPQAWLGPRAKITLALSFEGSPSSAPAAPSESLCWPQRLHGAFRFRPERKDCHPLLFQMLGVGKRGGGEACFRTLGLIRSRGRF